MHNSILSCSRGKTAKVRNEHGYLGLDVTTLHPHFHLGNNGAHTHWHCMVHDNFWAMIMVEQMKNLVVAIIDLKLLAMPGVALLLPVLEVKVIIRVGLV